MAEQNRLCKKSTVSDRLNKHYTDEEIKRQIEEYNLDRDNTPEKITVLYLDDEEDALTSFKALYRFDFKVFITSSHIEAKKIIEDNEIHVIISDQRMPEKTGTEFLEEILELYPDPIRILLTGYSDIDAVINAINYGQIYRYMSKPFEMVSMKQMIENAAEVYFLRKDKERLLKEIARANEQLEFMLRQKTLDI